MEFNPSTKKNRIEVVDALRGFALLGVLLANVPYASTEEVKSGLDPLLTFFIPLFDR